MQATFSGLRELSGNWERGYEPSPSSYGYELARLLEKVHGGEGESDHCPPYT